MEGPSFAVEWNVLLLQSVKRFMFVSGDLESNFVKQHLDKAMLKQFFQNTC